MKKTLIALAVLAASGASFAQSSVALTGTFGAGYQSYENGAVAAGTANTSGIGAPGAAAVAAASNKGISPVTDASIKFTVTEDLGGGLKATAAGQFAMNNSRGGNLTKEDSSVVLAGGFGTVAFLSTRTSDTAIAANVFASWLPRVSFYDTVSSRAATDILSYTTPAILPGLTFGLAQAEVTEGAVTSTQKANIISADYVSGPLTVKFAQKRTNELTSAQITANAKKTNAEAAVIYDLGVAKFGVGYDGATTGGTAYTSKAMTSYGVSVPMGAVTLGVNGAKRGERNFYDAGVNYDLSKRTSVRAQFGQMEGGSYAGNQYRVGVLHNF